MTDLCDASISGFLCHLTCGFSENDIIKWIMVLVVWSECSYFVMRLAIPTRLISELIVQPIIVLSFAYFPIGIGAKQHTHRYKSSNWICLQTMGIYINILHLWYKVHVPQYTLCDLYGFFYRGLSELGCFTWQSGKWILESENQFVAIGSCCDWRYLLANVLFRIMNNS